MKTALLLLGVLLLADCESSSMSPEEYASWQKAVINARAAEAAAKPASFDVPVITEPSGAAIEVDGDYQADTPCSVKIAARADRVIAKTTVIKATPREPGLYVQTKVLYQMDKLPNRLYFNMALRVAPTSVDVHVSPEE